MREVNVGDFAHGRQVVATTIVARVGRVVPARLQSFDGSAGRKGLTLALGAPGTGRQWYFPEGLVVDGLNERFQIFNPARKEVAIHVAFALEKSEAEPLRSEEHTSELQSLAYLVCRLLLEKKKNSDNSLRD